MPAAAWLAPDPAAPLSKTLTLAPRCARRHAIAKPITPAPMTATVGDRERVRLALIGGFLRWHDPDRFDGFDLSREGSRHPRPLTAISGLFALGTRPTATLDDQCLARE